MHGCGLLLHMLDVPRSVSVCVLVTPFSAAKTAEPIEMLFGLWTQAGLRNHVLDHRERNLRKYAENDNK